MNIIENPCCTRSFFYAIHTIVALLAAAVVATIMLDDFIITFVLKILYFPDKTLQDRQEDP